MSWTRTRSEDDKQCDDLIGVLTRLATALAEQADTRERCLACGHMAEADEPCPWCANEREARR